MQFEVHFVKIVFLGVQGSKNSEFFAVFGELEIIKLSRVYLSSNANEIWFQHRKYLRLVQVEVHFAKNCILGVQGSKNSEFFFHFFGELETGKLF